MATKYMGADPLAHAQLGHLADLPPQKLNGQQILSDMKIGSQSLQKTPQNEYTQDNARIMTTSKPA